MKIVHIESGLGNQMLSYCEYLAIKKMNPGDDCYIETMVYDIPECNDTICQWNGYELKRIFNIDALNISSLFSNDEWDEILSEVSDSKFWKKNWNWQEPIMKSLNARNLNIEVLQDRIGLINNPSRLQVFISSLKRTRLGTFIKGIRYKMLEKKGLLNCDNRNNIWIKTNRNILTGQWLSFKLRNNDLELLTDEIAEAFQFPPIKDERSLNFVDFLDSCNSIFIHARRGDMLSMNGWCYKYGYFRRAVNYMKKHVENPVFVFFTNPGSVEWCKENGYTFGLDYSKDAVYFVDWNSGEDSFRDMQMMAHCKHGIITNSSFGWWGAYFIENPEKITISPEVYINTTHHIY